MRDDFTTKTKEILAKRVGFRCSNPGCRKPTSGPRSDPMKAISIGVAAHITAASKRGPRYTSTLTPEQRMHPENGIWLCQNCAKLIDNDPDRYPADLLHQWKEQAEQTALENIEQGFLQRVIREFTGQQPQIEGGLEIRTPPRGLAALLGRKEQIVTLTPAQQRRNREKLLANVQSTWIDGYLHHAVHHAVYMEMGIAYKRDAISRPWDLTLQPADEPVPHDTPISDIFAEHGRSLLILGEPASGKTITLLQLVEALLAEARRDESCSIPVMFNLSSWARERLPLADWLAEEMFVAYQVSRPLTRAWLRADQLVLLLDGLDEVEEACRDDCIAAINDFKAGHPADIVVCSRIADYEKLSNRLNLSTAIRIQPLTPAQADLYLAQFGSPMDGVRVALLQEEEMQELAKSPLILGLMPFTYAGLGADQVATGLCLNEARRNLLAAYVRRVFQHRPLPPHGRYDQPRAVRWLTNLARGMAQHEQSIFYIERLQPAWLSTAPGLRCYRLILGLVLGLIFGLTFMLIFVWVAATVHGEWIWDMGPGPLDWLSAGLPYGLLVGLIGALVFAPISVRGDNIAMSEVLGWLPPPASALFKSTMKGALTFGVLGALVFGVIFWVLNGYGFDYIYLVIYNPATLVLGVISGLFGGLISGLNACIRSSETQRRSRPNQGIRSSTRNALRMGSLDGLTGALACGLMAVLVIEMSITIIPWIFTLILGLLVGLHIGLLSGLAAYGGKALVKHYMLRLFLARQSILPFPLRDNHLIAYLDAMADRILLRRVGGGWMFIHRYLLEYFASLGTEEAGQ